MELRYARPRTRRHGESPVGDWRRRFHGRLRGIASTAVKSPSPPSGFAMPPDAKSGLRRTRNFTKSTTRTLRHASGLRRTRKRRSADFTERARDVEFSRKRLSRTNGEDYMLFGDSARMGISCTFVCREGGVRVPARRRSPNGRRGRAAIGETTRPPQRIARRRKSQAGWRQVSAGSTAPILRRAWVRGRA